MQTACAVHVPMASRTCSDTPGFPAGIQNPGLLRGSGLSGWGLKTRAFNDDVPREANARLGFCLKRDPGACYRKLPFGIVEPTRKTISGTSVGRCGRTVRGARNVPA